MFKADSSRVLGNEIYIQNRILVNSDEDSPLTDSTLDTILDNVLIEEKANVAIDENNEETYCTLKDCVNNRILFSYGESKVEEGSTYNYLDTYFRLTLSKQLTGNETAKIRGYSEITTLSAVLDDYFNTTSTFTDSEYNSMALKTVSTVVNPSTPKWDRVLLGTSIALLAITLYLSIRYRLSRGLSSLFFPVVSSAITMGIMLLINLFLNMSASVIIAVPIVSLFSYLYLIQFYNRERELLLDDKVKDNSKEHRAEVAARALGIAYTPILATAVIGIYCLINFFGFAPSVMSNAYMAMFVGAIITLGIISIKIQH